MLRFFRKMRSALIPENRFGRYFFYALGEIVLVVIGILIALQINNLNENRKLKQTEKKLLIDIKENILLNINQFNSEIEDHHVQSQSIQIILNVLNNNLAYNDTLNRHFAKASSRTTVRISSSAYESLKSTGLNIISSKSLRIEIITLFEDTYPELNKEVREWDNTFGNDYPSFMLKNFTRYRGRSTPNNFEALKKDQLYKNILVFSHSRVGYIAGSKEYCIAECERVIKLIDAELNKSK